MMMNRTWQEVMQELAEDLEAEIVNRYPTGKNGGNRSYNRDMLIVKEAHQLLKHSRKVSIPFPHHPRCHMVVYGSTDCDCGADKGYKHPPEVTEKPKGYTP